MDSGFVTTGNCEIYYESYGYGLAVLYLHAGVADSRMWRNQLQLDGYRAVVFDQRGFGKTEWSPGPYSNRADALAVLDHLGIERAVIVGCSNGGEAAMQLALVAPDRVAGLVLVGAAPRGWQPEGGWADDPAWEDAVAAFQAGDIDRVVELDAQMWLAGRGRSLEDIDVELRELFRAMDRTPAATEAERDEFVQTLEPPTNERLDDITAPSQAIVGEYDHPDLLAAARYLSGKLRGGDVVVIQDAAHLPSLEAPVAFNTALRGFLAGL